MNTLVHWNQYKCRPKEYSGFLYNRGDLIIVVWEWSWIKDNKSFWRRSDVEFPLIFNRVHHDYTEIQSSATKVCKKLGSFRRVPQLCCDCTWIWYECKAGALLDVQWNMIKDDDESDHIHYIKLTSVHCFDRDVTASWGHRENQMTAKRKICDSYHSLLFTLA